MRTHWAVRIDVSSTCFSFADPAIWELRRYVIQSGCLGITSHALVDHSISFADSFVASLRAYTSLEAARMLCFIHAIHAYIHTYIISIARKLACLYLFHTCIHIHAYKDMQLVGMQYIHTC